MKRALIITVAILFGATAVWAQKSFVRTYSNLDGQVAVADSLFVLGASGADTSETLNGAIWWENVGVAYQADCNCGEDSIDYVLHFEGSIDGTNWFLLDSTSAVSDSLWHIDQVLTSTTLPPFADFRIIFLGRTGIQAEANDTTWLFADLTARGIRP